MMKKLLLLAISIFLNQMVTSKDSSSDKNAITPFNTKTTRVIASPKPYFYYISTIEGLLSHFNQLEKLWNIANSVNRQVVAVPFDSYHFPSLPQISLCNIFILPRNITCCEESKQYIGKHYNCTLADKTPWVFGLDPKTPTATDFDYSEIECFAGAVSMEITYGRYPKHDKIEINIDFQPKYYRMLEIVKDIIGVHKIYDTQYFAVHWRRGDQLDKRCKKAGDSHSKQNSSAKDHRSLNLVSFLHGDNTVNCGTVEEFIAEVERVKEKYCKTNGKKILTYVATNERDTKTLAALTAANYKLLHDFREEIVHHMHISELDEFVIDLMLMCTANYFIGWGYTATNGIVKRFRRKLGPSYFTHIFSQAHS